MEMQSDSTQTSTPYVGSASPDMSRGDEGENPPLRTLTKWQQQGGGDEPVLLENDHPLMKRFQDTLKLHLEDHSARLRDSIADIDAGIKLKQKEREELGGTMFTMEQEVAHQNKVLNDLRRELSSLMQMQQELESNMQESKQDHHSEAEKVNAATKTQNETQADIVVMINKERELRNFTEEAESDLTVSQRVSENTRIEKKTLAAEKRKQDMWLYRLSQEISWLEEQIVRLAGEFRSKEDQRDELCKTLADASSDLEVLAREQLRLLHAWNNVVITTKQRDKQYAAVQAELNEVQMALKTVGFDIESTRRETAKEQERNETLTMRSHRIATQTSDVQRAARILGEKRDLLEQQLAIFGTTLDQTENEAQKIKNETMRLETEAKLAQRDVDKWIEKKVELEDRILTDILDQTIGTQAVQSLSRQVKKLRDQTRHQELTMVEGENKLAATMLDAEHQIGENRGLSSLLDELSGEQREAEKQLQQQQANLKAVQLGTNSRNGMLSVMTRRLEVLQIRQGTSDLSPAEQKILNLERTITETVAKSEKLQQFWLRQEGLTVSLSQQRNHQLQDLNMIRRQVLILEQRRLKVEHAFDIQKAQERELGRSVEKLLNRLVTVNEQLHRTRGNRESLDHENRLTHSHYASVLKDEELATLQLEADITQGEADKQSLAEQLMSVQREALNWAGRCQIATETKEAFRRETRPDGDVGTMKCEIHRMQVRMSHLQQAQEKLMTDLNHCVHRRNHIVDVSEARDSRSTRAPVNVTDFGRQLDELRTKISGTYAKAEEVDEEMQILVGKQLELTEQLAERQNLIRTLQDSAAQAAVQLEDALLHKQKNLQVLLRKQRKASQYSDIKVFRHRPLFKNHTKLEVEDNKQQAMNVDLVVIIETLLEDFPDLRFPITRVLNTLQLPTS